MTKYDITISQDANKDICYIAQNYSADWGVAIAEHILTAINNLQYFPMKYQECQNQDLKGIRRCPVYSHTIYYAVNEEQALVKVYRVLHQRQMPDLRSI